MSENQEVYLRAYYHTFKTTGNIDVDRVLEAIAVAGRAHHHTSGWEEGEPDHWTRIQDAADWASARLARYEKALREIEYAPSIDTARRLASSALAPDETEPPK